MVKHQSEAAIEVTPAQVSAIGRYISVGGFARLPGFLSDNRIYVRVLRSVNGVLRIKKEWYVSLRQSKQETRFPELGYRTEEGNEYGCCRT